VGGRLHDPAAFSPGREPLVPIGWGGCVGPGAGLDAEVGRGIPGPCRESRPRDDSVGVALGYGQDDRGSRVPFPAGPGHFSLHHRVQKGSVAHPATYPMGTRGSFPEGKAAGA